MLKRNFLPPLALGILLCILSSPAFAVSVRPLSFHFVLEPGDVEEFELILTPGGRQETVTLNFYHPTQQITGGLSYEEADPQKHPAIRWVTLDNQVVVPPDEETRIVGEIQVPYGVEGSHTVIVMAEPLVDPSQTGIVLSVRYAVRVVIHVDRPGLRSNAEVLKFGIEPDEENRPILSAHLKNPSSLAYRATGEVTVRDEDRQLVQRVLLRSESASRAGRDETWIYPGAEVLFTGAITEPLFAGTYDLRLFLRYADGRQVIRSETVEVGEEYIDAERMEYIEVTPERVEGELRPGGAATEVVEMRNRTGDPLTVRIGGAEIEPDYPHSLFEAMELQIRGDQEFAIAPRRSGRSVLIFRSPREIEPGGYYGTFQVHVFDAEGEHLETRPVDLSMTIGEAWAYAAEVQALEYQLLGEELVLSAAVQNTGPVHLAPRGRIYLRNAAGEIVRTIPLPLQEGLSSILPQQTGLMTTSVTGVEPGAYVADIRIEYGGEELDAAEYDMIIEEEAPDAGDHEEE